MHGFTLILEDGEGSKGMRLLEISCGDNGLACTLKSSAMGETPEGAESNCRVITIDQDGAQMIYDCLDLYKNKLSVNTAAAPAPPAGKSNLESEFDGESISGHGEKSITIDFDKTFMINLWAMIIVFLVLNIGACYCVKKGIKIKSSERVFNEV